VGLLARLHDQVPVAEAESLTFPGEGDALHRRVAAQRAYYARLVDGVVRSPLVEDAFDRLTDVCLTDPGTPVLNWGDARIGNVIYDGFAPAFGQPALPDFLRRDRVEERYARLTGHTPRDMDFYTLYAALRHAVVMLRVACRQVHFGEVVVPADPDTLILHHGSLRAMVQGSYWD
jgi:aminoglycoside phosphotransferase (APT) family kinase protein